jgi:hypothetical protein
MFKLTTVRRALALAVAALLGGTAAVAFSVPGSSGAATSTTYSVTVAGTDAHSLSPGYAPMFVDGGGVQVNSSSTASKEHRILEAAIPLPVGARVTSITIGYSGCYFDAVGKYVFGSYAPATRVTAQVLTIAPTVSCSPKTITKSGSPITTVGAGRRYVLDWLYTGSLSGDPAPDFDTFYGATVRYTCTAPCVP